MVLRISDRKTTLYLVLTECSLVIDPITLTGSVQYCQVSSFRFQRDLTILIATVVPA